MRTAFVEELCAQAEINADIWLVCGDLGYSVLEQFSNCFPERFLNAGVAEQNMCGVAAGLALEGKIVFTYSIANFPVMRCLEQIRNDICYHNLNVKVVAVGGGLVYGSHGYTHHAVEDFAVTCPLPNITVAAPADPAEAREVARLAVLTAGPSYIRLGKAGEPKLHQAAINLQVGQSLHVFSGRDLTLISTGGMLDSALQVRAMLAQNGYSVAVISMPYLVPLDESAILDAASQTPAIITLEEHGMGGLGAMVATVLARHRSGVYFHPMYLRSKPVKISGSQEFLRQQHGLGVNDILQASTYIADEARAAAIKS
jgi:transketolase